MPEQLRHNGHMQFQATECRAIVYRWEVSFVTEACLCGGMNRSWHHQRTVQSVGQAASRKDWHVRVRGLLPTHLDPAMVLCVKFKNVCQYDLLLHVA